MEITSDQAILGTLLAVLACGAVACLPAVVWVLLHPRRG